MEDRDDDDEIDRSDTDEAEGDWQSEFDAMLDADDLEDDDEIESE
jgi:hypothetical protein